MHRHQALPGLATEVGCGVGKENSLPLHTKPLVSSDIWPENWQAKPIRKYLFFKHLVVKRGVNFVAQIESRYKFTHKLPK